jgi:acetolactate synthase-1/2/3 large subunit
MTGAKAIYNGLLNNKVKDVFMYSGGAIMSLIDLFKDKKINYYINNHEQNCGHAATAYAKSSNKPGVVIVTSGPGLTNMITPILDATNDSTPLVVFSGQVPIAAMGTLAFQECPATEITRPCTKWSYCAADGDDLFELTNEAFRVATNGKKGSVHIDLPKCVLNKLNGLNIVSSNLLSKSISNINYNFEEIINLIKQSKKPIVYIGKGCNEYSKELKEFIIKYNLPITSTIHSMGTFDETHPLSLGFLGMHGFPAANHSMQNADLIIAIGSRFDDRTTGNLSMFAPKCKDIIHINIAQSELGKIIKNTPNRKLHNINMDSGIFLNRINSYSNSDLVIDRSEWFSIINNWKIKYPITYNKLSNDKLSTQMVIEQINCSINQSDTIITSGVGNHQMMASQFIRWTQPSQFITSGSLGVMGVGLPYAIGTQIANPSKTVIDIDGDGSFNHTLGDLQTIQRYKLPIKIFIMNDHNMSMVRAWEKLFYAENYIATDCSFNPDYSMLANSYGIHSVNLSKQSDLEEITDYVIKYDGPILCNATVESDLCLPLVGPGKALDDMILLNDKQYNVIGDAPS